MVRIDLIAADARGRIVDNLKSADFELHEDGTPQSIDEVRFVKVDGTDTTRSVAIFLDDYHVSGGAATTRAREALTRFVDQDLGPRDLVTVMRPLDSLLAIRLTRDRATIHQAINAFAGRKGDYTPRTPFEQNYMASGPARIDAVRAQVTMSALSALVIHLGSLGEARKHLVLVSEMLPRAERGRGFDPLPTFETVVGAANRSNVAIYTVDPREPSSTAGDAQAADSVPRETLRALADETDGAAIAGAADLQKEMRRISRDSSAYYLLTYRSTRGNDGRFHDVQVRVKRPGVRVRARKGYVAPTAGERQRATRLAQRVDTTPTVPLAPVRRTSPLVRSWFGLARGDGGKTRVTFVWEPAAPVPGARAARAASRVVLTASGPDGSAVFEGPLIPAGPKQLASEGGAARAVFDVPPGRLQLRMAIEDAAARVIDSDVREIAIRDLRAPVALGTPQVLRARTARELRALDADPNAVPVASRKFSRAEHLLIRFPAYAPVAPPMVSAKLLSRIGKAMRELAVRPAAAPGGQNQIALPLAGLAAGEYLLEITATSPAGEVKDLVGFRVTS